MKTKVHKVKKTRWKKDGKGGWVKDLTNTDVGQRLKKFIEENFEDKDKRSPSPKQKQI